VKKKEIKLDTELGQILEFANSAEQSGYNVEGNKNLIDIRFYENNKNIHITTLMIEVKLESNETTDKKAYTELFLDYPKYLQQKGFSIPQYRGYYIVETGEIEIYNNEGRYQENIKVKTGTGYNFEKLDKYLKNKPPVEYSLTEKNVDLVAIYQKVYGGVYNTGENGEEEKYVGLIDKKKDKLTWKTQADDIIKRGVEGWFKGEKDFAKLKNKLIKDREKMSEKTVQKMAGEFFTPPKYAKISAKMVDRAVEDAFKAGYKDYIIIDRCAGSGNLEVELDEKHWNHLILGTLQESDANITNIRFDGKAICNVEDALSEKGVNFYKQKCEEAKVENKAVIFYENPPYFDGTSNMLGRKAQGKHKTWYQLNANLKLYNDLDSQFIQSVKELYNCFQYIHYGPIKTFKSQRILSGLIQGHICNRKHFNASESGILLGRFNLSDQNNMNVSTDTGTMTLKFVDKFVDTLLQPATTGFCKLQSQGGIRNAQSSNLANNIKGHVKIVNINEDNLLINLPLFVCDWWEDIDYSTKEVIMKSADGGTAYQQDVDFLNDCAIWTWFTNKNKCSSDCKIWEELEKQVYLKSNDWKQEKQQLINEMIGLYRTLSKETGLNGLANIEKFNKQGNGKLWKYHHLYPTVQKLREKLKEFYNGREENKFKSIKDKMFQYELLK